MKSVLQHVLEHARTDPGRLCVQTCSQRHPERSLTFAEVALAAERAAGLLQANGVGKGDLVVLIGTHDVDFYGVWLGAVWLGAVPTVLAEPSVRVDRTIYWSRLAKLLEHIDAKLLAAAPSIELPEEKLAGLRHVTFDQLAASRLPAPQPIEPESKDLLLLQHSSGTTGLQKGVMLSHGAVMRHATAYGEVLGLHADDVVATWLPLYHDMGMIACFVNPLIAGVPVVWLSPFEWIANPGLLLEAITRQQATLLWLPNFAFSFLAERVRSEADELDLSTVRAVINCSEPVTGKALSDLSERFASDGFREDALHTCYAMAETVFAVTTSRDSDPPRRLWIDPQIWQQEHRAAKVGENSAHAMLHVSSGRCLPGCEVRINSREGDTLPEFRAGNVLVRASYLFAGYFRRPDLNHDLLDADGYFDTGDLGYVDDRGHLYVTGRSKDLIIVGGRNVYPQEIEDLIGRLEGIHPGRVVCFGVSIRRLGTQGIVVLAETSEPENSWPELSRRIRTELPRQLDLDLFDARIQPRGRLRKSTSGKLARDGNRTWYLEGRFGPPPVELISQE